MSSAAERRLKWARTALKAANIKQQEAEVALKAAKKGVTLANLNVEHAKMYRDLQEVREAHVACKGAASTEAGPSAKKPPRSSAPEPEPAEPEQQHQQEQGLGTVEQAKQDLATAQRRLRHLSQEFVWQERRQKDTARQLADLRSAHRDCRVAASDETKWEWKDLRCTSKTIFMPPLWKAFVATLTTAPCLKSLHLHLPRSKSVPKSLQETLPRAPARIKQLLLNFGGDSETAVMALLQRVQGHLEELLCLNIGFRKDDDIRRFWSIIEDSNIAILSLAADPFLRDVGFNFEPEKWRHLHTLKLSGHSFSRVGRDEDTKSVLVPLVLATAASLRVFELPWDVAKEERAAVFAALCQCSELEEVSTPCYREVALLQGCAKLKKLKVHRTNMSESPEEETDAEIQAVAEFLQLPSTVDGIESLKLRYFQIDEERVLPIIRAVQGMKKLKSLSLDHVSHFPEMEATLKSLPCLEELRLICGHWMYPETVREITPAIAPNLKLLEVETEELAEYEELDSWRGEVDSLERKFQQKNKSFKLIDKTSFSPPPSSDD